MAIRLRDRTFFFNTLVGGNLERGIQRGFYQSLQDDLRQKRRQEDLAYMLEKTKKLANLQNELQQQRIKQKEQKLLNIFADDIKKNPDLAKQIKASVRGFSIPQPKVRFFSKIDVGDKVVPLLIFDDGSVKAAGNFVKKLSPKEKVEFHLKAKKLEEYMRHNRATEGIAAYRANTQRQLGFGRLSLQERLGLARLNLQRQKLNLARQLGFSRLQLQREKLKRTGAKGRKNSFDKYLSTYLSLDRKIAELQSRNDILSEDARKKAIQRLQTRQAELEKLMQVEDPNKYKVFRQQMKKMQQPTAPVQTQTNPLAIFEE